MKHYLNLLSDVFSISKVKKTVVFQLFISYLFAHLSRLVPPTATAGIISVITDDNQNFHGIWIYVAIYLGFFLLHYVMLAWHQYAYTYLAHHYRPTVQQQLFQHVINNVSIFDKISKGKITETCSMDVSYIVDILSDLAKITAHLIQLFVIFIIFCFSNIFVALFALAINTLYIYLMNQNSHKVARYYEGTRKYRDKVTDILTQMLSSIKQVRSLNMLPSLSKKLTHSHHKWRVQSSGRFKYITERYCRIPIIIQFGKISLYILLAYLVSQNRMKISELILLISYFEMVVRYLDHILEYSLNLNNNSIRIKRIKAILGYTSNSNIDFGDIDNDYIKGTIVFDKVSFSIDHQLVLSDVSFKALPNEITAIVGYPGSGKTTIMSLLYRLYRIKSGSILIDDESIYNYTREVYSSNVSGVFQHPFIFDMSIRDNLSLVNSNLKAQVSACRRVNLHHIIEKLPNGYNTILKQENNTLTSGQFQKLAIARAILSHAEILLFDEVTSNVDPETTLEVIDILKGLREDHTILIISHNPEIMRIADRVVVLKNGRVVSKGKNQEVYHRSALYRELRNAYFARPSLTEKSDII